jgi:hypothetical protein
MIPAAASIILKHLGEALLELQGQPLAHDPNAIDGVYERLCLGFEQIANQYRDHDSVTRGKIYSIYLNRKARTEYNSSIDLSLRVILDDWRIVLDLSARLFIFINRLPAGFWL